MHKHTKTQKSWRQRQLDKGLCPYCTRSLIPGKTRCEYHLEYHRVQNKKERFGLDREAHEALLQSQNYECGICRCEIDQSSHIDHCHETGRVRGILCRSCNTALGIYEKKIRPLKDRIELYLHA